MAKLNEQLVIGTSDFEQYLNEHSSFAFELAVLREIRKSTKNVRHAELYVDPLTSKRRQFDLRVTFASHNHIFLLAIECKCIGRHFPLLVSCVPRVYHEAFHDIIAFNSSPSQTISVVRVSDCADGPYGAGEPVGKSCAQVGRAPNKDIVATDDDMFDKWTQAVASARALLDHVNEYKDGRSRVCVLPIVVVPDHCLWTVEFDQLGNAIASPKEVDRTTVYLNNEFTVGFHPGRFSFSHLEVHTMNGLRSLMARLAGPDAEELYFCD